MSSSWRYGQSFLSFLFFFGKHVARTSTSSLVVIEPIFAVWVAISRGVWRGYFYVNYPLPASTVSLWMLCYNHLLLSQPPASSQTTVGKMSKGGGGVGVWRMAGAATDSPPSFFCRFEENYRSHLRRVRHFLACKTAAWATKINSKILKWPPWSNFWRFLADEKE